MSASASSSGRRARAVILLPSLLLSVAAGCSDQRCPAVHPCDGREAACQSALMEVAACLYDAPVIASPVRVISDRDFVSEQTRDADPVAFERAMRARALFGLVPRGLTLEQAAEDQLAQLAGYYDATERAITLIDRGLPLDEPSALLLLVHEFIHALQHERTTLLDDSASVTTSDAVLAQKAISEGEASLFEDMAYIEGLGWDFDELDLRRHYSWWRQQSLAYYMAQQNALYAARSSFVYAFGTAHAYEAWRAGGLPKIAERRAELPESVHPFLHSGPVETEPLADQAFPVLGEAFVLEHHDSYGPWLLLPFLRHLDSETMPPTLANATKLRGDSVSYFYNATDDVLAVWRLRFSTEAAADNLQKAVTGFGSKGSLKAWREGRDVIVLGSDNRQVIDDHYRKLQWEAAPSNPVENENEAAGRPRRRATHCVRRAHSPRGVTF